MKFLHRTPFFRLLLPLVAGIVIVQNVKLPIAVIAAMLAVSAVLLFIPQFFDKQKYSLRWLSGAGIMLFICAVGFFLSQQKSEKSKFPVLNSQKTFLAEIAEKPVEKEKSVLCKVLVMQCVTNSAILTINSKALIYIQKSERAQKLKMGDRLLFNVTFNRPDGALNPAGFDYAKYLKRQNIGATAYISDDNWEFQGKNPNFSLKRLAVSIQQNLLDVYKRFGISGDEYVVLAALTLGSKDALHPDLQQFYSISGGMHILAVSGLHVGVIYAVFAFLLGFMNKKPRAKALIIVLLLWCYALITGLAASAVRASLMFSLVAIGTSLQRKAQIYNTISLSAFFMLLINPDYLFDVGFQLSYMAVAAIIYVQPKIARMFYIKNKILRWVWDLTAVSIAAQVGTAAISIFYFNQFPNYFWLTNLFAIPLATLIIYAAVALFALSPIPYISDIVAFVLKWLLKSLNFGIHAVYDLPYPITPAYFNPLQVLLFYLATIFLLFFLHSKKFSALCIAVCSLLAVFLFNLGVTLNTINSRRMIIYAGRQDTHIDFISGSEHQIFSTDLSAMYRTAGSYWLSQRLKNPSENTENYGTFYGKTFYILQDDIFRKFASENTLEIDFLIVGNGAKPYAEQVFGCIAPKKVIADQSISDWYSTHLREICEQRGIEFYSVAENGAFVWEAE